MGSTFESQLAQAGDLLASLRDALKSVIVGQQQVIEQVIWALIANGHVLLEGAPGLGKTLLVKTLSRCLELDFRRIQFTPDLMPSDITGTQILGQQPGQPFVLHRGPLFTQLLLADEINRATPKTQSALLEAMQERACTIGGEQHPLDAPFFVLATQNPIEMEGTYPLPEAQLDRFLLQILIHAPDEDDMTAIVKATTGTVDKSPTAVMSGAQLIGLQELCRKIHISDEVLRYAVRLTKASDPNAVDALDVVKKALRYGAGVRGAQALTLTAKARALSEGRPQVGFADVEAVAPAVLRHRLLRSFEGEAEGIATDEVIGQLLGALPKRPAKVEAARL